MRVIEQVVVARRGGVASLDAIVRTDRWVAVLDQSTPKEGPEPSFLDRLQNAFMKLDNDRMLTAAEIVEALSAPFRPPLPSTHSRPCVSVVFVDAVQRRVIRVGDGHVVIDGLVHVGRNAIDEVLGRLRTFLLELEGPRCDGGPTDLFDQDHARVAMLPWLRKGAKLFRNHPTSQFGFGALDGGPVPSRFIEEFQLPDSDCSVSIMTDGYPIPHQLLEVVEAELAALLDRDPSMASMNTTKGLTAGSQSFDDRAFVRLVLERVDHA